MLVATSPSTRTFSLQQSMTPSLMADCKARQLASVYLPLSPRVAELCTAIEAVGGERAGSQVLLAADGRQMDPQDLVGNYSVGTVSEVL